MAKVEFLFGGLCFAILLAAILLAGKAFF